jgi:hypothetical protein
MSSDRTIIAIMGTLAKGTQFWFKSTLFEIEPGEDKETNPRCYGKQLANWLRQKLVEKGYAVEEVGPEDWGWYFYCTQDPFILWVRCVSVRDYKFRPLDPPPRGKDVIWTCIIDADLRFFARLFRRVDPTSAVEALSTEVGAILRAEQAIVLTAQP